MLRFFEYRRPLGWCQLALALVLLSGVSFAAEHDGDTTWAPYTIAPPLETSQINDSSFYVTMRDGVEIAVTLYLPENMARGAKLPAILHATRYVRALEGTGMGKNKVEEPDTWIRTFLANGYAYLGVDARGTGASTGRWSAPWAPDEWKDYGEIIDWIVQQPWSTGSVGTRGVSYDGTTAEMTAANVHPALKAAPPSSRSSTPTRTLVRRAVFLCPCSRSNGLFSTQR